MIRKTWLCIFLCLPCLCSDSTPLTKRSSIHQHSAVRKVHFVDLVKDQHSGSPLPWREGPRNSVGKCCIPLPIALLQGRTGSFCCAWLLYTKAVQICATLFYIVTCECAALCLWYQEAEDAEDALNFFALRRWFCTCTYYHCACKL